MMKAKKIIVERKIGFVVTLMLHEAMLLPMDFWI